MKLRIAIILVLLAISVSIAEAQNNCCMIQTGGTLTTGTLATVPPSSSNPGGEYYPTLTETTPISCIDSADSKPCNSTSTPSNVVTAAGTYGYAFGRFIPCNPLFKATTTQTSSMTSSPSYQNVGTSYISVDANGNCVPNPVHPFALSTCVTKACPPPQGGGVCSTCPPQKPSDCCTCPCGSPIILDITGKGYNLTSDTQGVLFDISGNGKLWQMSWTAAGADNAFLALPGPDGLVHNGQQLFGNFTPQPPCPAADKTCYPNGFRALAVYDDPKNGGNGDGIIDTRDAIFSSLRLWIDANHDGISQPEELHTLPSLGINSISLSYKESDRTDQYGNVFRYRARLNPDEQTDAGKTAYDIFFKVVPTGPTAQACPAPPATGKQPASAILKH